MTRNYNLPDDIPFTTAASDFQKLLKVGAEYNNKKSLVDYAATDFGSLRTALISYMKTVYPTDYQNFTESDFAMMFTELVAYMGSIMSFKADALANENFLSTAQNRRNVKKLLELVGVRLKGPTSAGANAQIVLDSAYGGSEFTLAAANRSITISSPLDGAQLTFTIYKTLNGKLSDMGGDTTDLVFNTSESTDPTSPQTWTNAALVEGALVEETGTFNSTEVFKSIALTQGPVVENSVQVFITAPEDNLSGVYSQVDNIFAASGNSDKIFDVLYDDTYNGTVRFGDGVVGASPANSSRYRVLYRVGGGARGNLLGYTIAASITAGDAGAATISNTGVAAGGLDAESISMAKKYGPLVFKQQDRLVTLGDFESFVARYNSPTGGTAIGTAATREAHSSANIIDVYVLQKATENQLQKATVEYKTNLLSAMQSKKMLTDEVVIVDGLIRTLDLVITLFVDKAYSDTEEQIKAQALNTITEFFSYDKFGFNAPFVPQDLNRKIFDLDAVRYSTIDNFTDTIKVDFNEVIQLNNVTLNVTLI